MTDRRSISQKRRAEIVLSQGCLCKMCGTKLIPSQYEIDHIAALIHGGSNEEYNLQAICKDCHKLKTREDVHARAHADRIAAGGRKRKGAPLPGSRASGWKKRMDGTVVKR
jgi:5-methylcytosine-specific restriction enzyme A